MAPVQGPAGQRASIAVVGSGIAGLSAAYLLSEKFDVTLFEAHDRPGMDAYSVTIPRQHGLPPFRMDAPLRVFSRTFYPRLTALYEHIGVPFEETNYHLCVSRPSEPAFFRYVCLRIGRFGIALPWLSIRAALFHGMKAVRVLIGAARFWWHGPADLRRGALDGITLGEYTKQRAFSDTFVRDALLPMLSGAHSGSAATPPRPHARPHARPRAPAAAVCTCSYEAVLLYPAAIVVDYLTVKHSATSAPWHRARHLRVTCGICEVAERLASACHSIQNGTSVVAVRGAGQGGRRRPAVLSVPTRSRKAGGSDDGPVPLPRAGAEPREQEFDHVVVATQGEHVRSEHRMPSIPRTHTTPTLLSGASAPRGRAPGGSAGCGHAAPHSLPAVQGGGAQRRTPHAHISPGLESHEPCD